MIVFLDNLSNSVSLTTPIPLINHKVKSLVLLETLTLVAFLKFLKGTFTSVKPSYLNLT